MSRQKGFQLDLNRCVGCHACQVACANENRLPPGANWRQVYKFNELRHPDLPVFNLSIACNHCADPACLRHCPAGAYTKGPDTGVVQLDQQRCLGCKYCSWVCPYDAPRFNLAQRVMEKCTFCAERLADGQAPACVACCPTGALQLIEIETAIQAPKTVGFPDSFFGPAIRFIPVRESAQRPEITSPPPPEIVAESFMPSLRWPPAKISLRSEWALLVFTLLAALLTAAVTASQFSDLSIQPVWLLAAGFGAMLLSTIHLGQKQRAWRAMVNWRQSWLSMEIISFSLFLCLSSFHLLLFPSNWMLGGATVIAGFISLIAIDQVYRMALKPVRSHTHSAHVLLIGLYLTGIFMGSAVVAGIFGGLKLFLYLRRKYLLPSFPKLGWACLSSSARVGLGIGLPVAVVALSHPSSPSWLTVLVILAAIAGELIDRSEFYTELDIITPRKQILLDLNEELKRLRH